MKNALAGLAGSLLALIWLDSHTYISVLVKGHILLVQHRVSRLNFRLNFLLIFRLIFDFVCFLCFLKSIDF